MEPNLDTIFKYVKPEGECWIWTRAINTHGYPRAVVNGDTNTLVHRLVYELYNKEPLGNFLVRHSCDNPRCLNPKHLLKGTIADNNRDRDLRGRNGIAKITHDEVKAIRDSKASLKILAQQYNLCETTISSIRLRRHWQWL